MPVGKWWHREKDSGRDLARGKRIYNGNNTNRVLVFACVGVGRKITHTYRAVGKEKEARGKESARMWMKRPGWRKKKKVRQ